MGALKPGFGRLEFLGRALQGVVIGGNLVTDARSAALALECQAEIHSYDADFGRSPGLPWWNRLVS